MYVAVKGTVFDVTRNKEKYGPGESYSVFLAKDASVGLAKTSLDPEVYSEDLTIDDLTEKEKKVLDDWYLYYVQRYNIMGTLID